MKKIYLLFFWWVLVLITGRSFGQTYILNEDFSSASETTPPTGWLNNATGGGAADKWRFNNPGIRTLNYPFTGNFAIFDSDNYSQADGAENVILESKFFDASISSNTLLTFDHFFAGGKNGKGTLEIFNGTTWSVLDTYVDSTANPESKLYNISAKVGGVTNAKVRFRWTGNASYYWALDNIRIYAPLSRDGGLVKLSAPEMPFSSGSQAIKVGLGNYGINSLTSTTLNWQVNGVAQTPYNWTGSLAFGKVKDDITLANYNFQQGKAYQLKIWQENPNGQKDLNALNDTIIATLYSSLSGVYTIGGSSPDFKTFTEAVTVLNNAGVVGPVTFKVRNGTYNEQVVIGKVTGASATNKIVFESESGDSTKAVLSYNQENSVLDYTLLVNGGEYLSFKKLGFIRSSNSNIVKIEKSRYTDFANCSFNSGNYYFQAKTISIRESNNITIANSRMLYTYISLQSTSGDVAGCSDIIIRRNRIEGLKPGYYSVYAYGAYAPMNKVFIDSNLITGEINLIHRWSNSAITSNTISDGKIYQYTGGYSTSGNVISNNSIVASAQTGYAINIEGNGVAEISGNKITGVTNANAINLNGAQGTLIANNFVQTQGQGTTYGISLNSSSNVKVVFNSVHTTGTDLSQARAFSVQGNNGNFTVKNNIFANSGGGYAAFIGTALTGTNDLDYNDYYSSGGKLGHYAGTDYTNLSTWGQALKGDANSKAVNPFFKNKTEPHINHIALNNAGTSISGFTKDIDGITRDARKPDIGAKEYIPVAIDAGLDAITSPQSPLSGTTIPVKVLLRNQGLSTLSSATINWQVNGVAQPPINWSGSLASTASEEVTLKTYTFTGAPLFNIKTWTSSPNNQLDPNRYNDTATVQNLVAALSGVYTIGGSSPDFKTFTEAVTVLNNAGVVGPVTFKVRNGTYNEQVVIGKVTGASATNKIVFESESGDSTKAVLSYNQENSVLDYTLLVNGGEYLSFKKLGFIRSSNSNIVKIEKSRYTDFANCSFNSGNYYFQAKTISIRESNNITIANSRMLYTYISLQSTSGDVAGCSDIIIRRNRIEGLKPGYYSVYAYGAYAPMNKVFIDSNLITGEINLIHRWSNSAITSNTISDGKIYQYTGGYSTSGNVISNNSIVASAQTGYAINIEGNGVAEISGNKITGVTNANAINLNGAQGTLIANNFVQTQGQGTTYGISLNSSSNVKVVFNSVHTTGTDLSQARAFSVQGNNGNFTVKNNIFANSGGGYAAFIGTALTGTNDLDYNDYYSSGGKLGHYAGTDYTNLSTWGQALKGDANSKAVNPFFKSKTDLDTNHIALNDAGTPVTNITKDIDSTTRNSSKPDIGAKEYTPIEIDAGLDAIITPTSPLISTSVPVKVLLRNQGLNTLSSATLNWQINKVTQTPVNWSGNLVSGASEEVTLKTHNFSGASIFDIDAWATNPNSQQDLNRYNDTATVQNLVAALSGVYTIGGSSPDFKTFTEAVTVLNNAGVVGPVTFKVRNGTYNEQVVIGKVTGASATNKIVFESESGDSTKAVLSYNQENSVLDYTLLVNGGEYLSFKKLGFIRSSNSNIVKIEKSRYTDFANCSFNSGNYYFQAKTISIRESNNITIANSRMLYTYISLQSTSGDVAGCSDIIIRRNRIEGLKPGYYSVYAYGAYAPMNKVFIDSNLITGEINLIHRWSNSAITSNTISDGKIYQYTGGYSTSGNVISNNSIVASAQTGYAINIEGNGVAEISGNKITGVTNANAINLNGAQGTLIANNFVQTQGQGTTYGISLNSSSNVKVVFNSVHTTGTDLSQARAFSVQGNNGNFTVKNNIFANSGGGYAAYIGAALSGTNDIDYNDYYSSGGKLGHYAGTDYTNLSTWGQALKGDANSKAVNPFFKSKTEFRTYQRNLNGAGIPVAGVLLDIDGEIRNSSAPDIGADEFTVDFGITRLISPALDCDQTSSESVTANIIQFGDIPFTNLKVAYQVNKGPIFTETIPGSINNDIEYTFKESQNLLKEGQYDFKVWLVGIQDDNVSNDTLRVARFKKPSPTVSFNFTTKCAGVAVPFLGTASVSPGTITRYEWNFGDGDSAVVQNPNHIYAQSGTYTVTLKAYSDEGCYSAVSKTVTIIATPEAKFAEVEACINEPLTFTNQSTVSSGSMTYNWNFGDGSTSTEQHPSHTYRASGTYKVQLTVSNTLGCSNTYTQEVKIYSLPTVTLAAFTPVCTEAATFTLAGGLPKGGSYSGTGVKDGQFSASVAGIGTHTITYTYTNENGCTNAATSTIVVKSLPTVSFTGLPTSLCVNAEEVTLSGSPAGGVWVGNGMNANGVFNPATAGVGTHTIEYIYSEAGGCSNKATKTITINEAPENLTASSNSPVTAGASLTLSAATITNAIYAWTGPNNFTATTQKATIENVTSSAAGTYTVTATVNGCSVSATVSVSIQQAVAVSSFSPLSGPVGTVVTIKGSGFTNISSVKFNNTNASYAVKDAQTIVATVPAGSSTGLISVTTPNGTATSNSNFTVLSNTITGSALSVSRLCAGSPVNVPFTTTGSFNGSNIFKVQLSDAKGSFAVPITIGVGNTSPVAAFIPVTTITGTGYRVRVISSNPAVIGTDNGTNLSVQGKLATPVVSANSPVLGGVLKLRVNTVPGATYKWTGPNGFTSTLHNPTINKVTGRAAGMYSVTVLVNGCTSNPGTVQVIIVPVPKAITLVVNTVSGYSNTQVLVPVRVKDLKNIMSIQGSINWNTAVATYVGVESFGLKQMTRRNFGTTQVNTGKLSFSWKSAGSISQSLNDNAILFAVRLKLVGPAGSFTPISVTNKPVKIEVTDKNLNVVEVKTKAGAAIILSEVAVTGTIRSEAGSSISGVTIKATSSKTNLGSKKVTTLSNGNYRFNLSYNQPYVLTPSKKNDVEVTNGVTTLDLVHIQRHISKKQLLNSPYKIIAADVNGSGTVTNQDINLIRAFILGYTKSFPGGRLWRFVRSDFTFASITNPFPFDSARTYSKISSLSNQDFIGMKLGDVTNSWDATNARIQIAGDLNFNLLDLKVLPDTEIRVPVTVKNFRNVSGYQFTLNWDPTVLEFTQVENAAVEGIFGTHSVRDGKLTTAWSVNDNDSLSLADDTQVFQVRFKVIGNGGTKSKIAINSAITGSVAYTGSLKQLNVLNTEALIKVKDFGFELKQNYPNPFRSETTIGFTVPEQQQVTFTIYNALGQVVKRTTGIYPKGEHAIIWKLDDSSGLKVSSGTYFCRMQAGKFSETIQMIVSD
ncbi:PKD domain-containing protein [Adhaeribacter radiodurans]|uniref:Probable pectate lyase C n=1 Tax=Adhaeribacter radiodurans TaxID=2745197 RepID=A0A7L7LAJ7_9BACT|nr:PKD domain-containing protein [Adhaeribacter radiodurans]QMU29862.1 PKD domain-containing protein [Adhaeribacter radiodurans]